MGGGESLPRNKKGQDQLQASGEDVSREKNETRGKFWLVLISGLVRQHQNMFWGFVKSICTERILPFCPQHMVFVAWLIKTLYAMNSPIKLPQLIFKNLMFVVVYIWVHWKYTRPYFPHFSQQPQNKGSTGQKKKKNPTGKFHEISKFNRLEHSKCVCIECIFVSIFVV